MPGGIEQHPYGLLRLMVGELRPDAHRVRHGGGEVLHLEVEMHRHLWLARGGGPDRSDVAGFVLDADGVPGVLGGRDRGTGGIFVEDPPAEQVRVEAGQRRCIGRVVVASLLVPNIVLLVALYLTIVDPPLLGTSLINSFWAIWLPAGANAFNVLLVMRFFDSLPREVFEAARMDGAGPYRLFWSIIVPMSKPIIGVVSVFAVIGAWKDFLWPLLVLKDPSLQPLSVRLPQLQQYIELDVFLAALAISTVIPIILFLVFQRLFLNGAGLGGALKG